MVCFETTALTDQQEFKIGFVSSPKSEKSHVVIQKFLIEILKGIDGELYSMHLSLPNFQTFKSPLKTEHVQSWDLYNGVTNIIYVVCVKIPHSFKNPCSHGNAGWK